jgi:NAD(P)-dependent dehydrogenase (short-subunit alcohol dehydrogenase family)
VPAWTIQDIPSQTGRTAIITGTGGLGYETALALARAGASVILAGRNAAKGAASVARITGAVPGAKIAFAALDLASLASVKTFADGILASHATLDLLINNAGVMAPPQRQTTQDGFELQFGTNYLGHFALTAHLLPLLRKTSRPRVVNLSSIAHRTGFINFNDLQWERSYRPWGAYGQSKLAMLMFALELQRRSDAAGWGLISNAAGDEGLLMKLGDVFKPLVSQSAAEGALPTLYAATSPDAKGGAYYGPDGFYELKGAPREARIMPQASNKNAAARLWEISEALTHVKIGEEQVLA